MKSFSLQSAVNSDDSATSAQRESNTKPSTEPAVRRSRPWSLWPQALGADSLLAAGLAPDSARGCACGCGVFDVGGTSMLPTSSGGMAFVEYDYQDQTHNYSGFSRSPADDNGDKEIRTHFVTLGAQYLFNRDWGVQISMPYDYRTFTTLGGASGNDRVTLNWWSPGDLRLEGIYTGFSKDLSTGVSLGLKLPTGSWQHNDVYGDIDRDSEIGTGSTDILIGGFHRGSLTADRSFQWFAHALLDVPALTQDHYRPGVELDAAAGIYYTGWSVGGVKIRPIAQIIGSERTADTGANATGGANDDPAAGVSSGYQRILLSPGVEFVMHPVHIYADVELPVLEHVTGNQLVAPVLVKLVATFHF